MSLSSGMSAPGVPELASPVGNIAPQHLVAQLTAWAESKQSAQHLKLYTWLRDGLQRSIIFELFEDRCAVQDVCMQRLRALPHADLVAIVAQGKDLIAWRQDGIGPAKVSDPRSPSDVVGLLAAGCSLLGPAAMARVCHVAKENISAQQPVEKRYNVLLLALAAALAPPEHACDFVTLRHQCKAALQLMKNFRPKLQQERRLRLVRRMARVLTHKQAERLAVLPELLAAPEPRQDGAAANTPSDSQFVLVDVVGAQHAPHAGDGHGTGDAVPDKQAFTKNWLASLWG